MEISNNRIKVTSMKTFAKFFLHFSLVILSCLTAKDLFSCFHISYSLVYICITLKYTKNKESSCFL